MKELSNDETSYRNFAYAYTNDMRKELMYLKNQLSKRHYSGVERSLSRLRDLICLLESVNDKLVKFEE